MAYRAGFVQFTAMQDPNLKTAARSRPCFAALHSILHRATIFLCLIVLFDVPAVLGEKPPPPRKRVVTKAKLKSQAGNYVYSEMIMGNVKAYILVDKAGRCQLFTASPEAIASAVEKETRIVYAKTKCTYKVGQEKLFFYDEIERRDVFCSIKTSYEVEDSLNTLPSRRLVCKGWRFDFALQPDFDPEAPAVK